MENKENIIRILKEMKPTLHKYGLSGIGLFGSYLYGMQTPKSDIDLLIDFEPGKESYDGFMAIYDLIEEAFENEKVEVITKNSLSRHIGPEILREVQNV
ncbi:MAG: nucleotidyltransferase family protein [Chitinophagaceae bacterium]|nr:nucleotidyltransferase family protein [Chitinophagaceae bacterium]